MKLDRQHIQQLVAKYEKSLPRYTSYPTAPEWHEIDSEWQKDLVEDSARQQNDLSLYFHIPFCESRCLFCGCNTIISRDKTVADGYLELMLQEIREFSKTWQRFNPNAKVRQIHFGGGTPTFLTNQQITTLTQGIKSQFNFADDVEFSVEIDPAPTELNQLELLRDLGVNRISIGVQDFNENIVEQVNRPQSLAKIESLFKRARDLKYSGINIDLIYGLPGQNPQNFDYSIQKALELTPDRIALFSYAHVPWMKPHQKTLEKWGILQGYDKFQLFLNALEGFTENGYQYIGLDHFALKNDSLAEAQRNKRMHRNFQGYTTLKDLDLLAFGVSSISGTQLGYWQNPRDLAEYKERFPKNPMLAIRGHKKTKEDILRHQIIINILCHNEYQQQNTTIPTTPEIEVALKQAIEDGLIQGNTMNFQLTTYGQLFSRNIAALFDHYLANKTNGEKRFSKSI